MKLKVITNGTAKGTVIVSDDGREVENVRKINIKAANNVLTVTVTFVVTDEPTSDQSGGGDPQYIRDDVLCDTKGEPLEDTKGDPLEDTAL